MDGLEEELGRLGARVAPQWLAACVDFLQGSQPGLAGAPAPVRAKAVLQQLLAADLNQCGAPALPPGVQVRPAGERWLRCQILDRFRTLWNALHTRTPHRRQPPPAADFCCLAPPNPLLPGPARHRAAGQAAAASGRGGQHRGSSAGALLGQRRRPPLPQAAADRWWVLKCNGRQLRHARSCPAHVLHLCTGDYTASTACLAP